MEGFFWGFLLGPGERVCLGFFPWLIQRSYWGLVGREYHTQRHGILLTPHVAATIPTDREAEMKLPRKPVITAANQLGAVLPSRGRATPGRVGAQPQLQPILAGKQSSRGGPGGCFWCVTALRTQAITAAL